MVEKVSRLKPKNGDTFTAWRIYERAVTEMAPLMDKFVETSEKNREAWARLEGVQRTQSFWLAALTCSSLILAWRLW